MVIVKVKLTASSGEGCIEDIEISDGTLLIHRHGTLLVQKKDSGAATATVAVFEMSQVIGAVVR